MSWSSQQLIIAADFIRLWNDIICSTCLFHLLSPRSTETIRIRSSVPFYHQVDEHRSAIDGEIRHAFTISFHKERCDRLSWDWTERPGWLLRTTGPATEVIYEGNRTAHEPHNVLPPRQYRRGEWTNGLTISDHIQITAESERGVPRCLVHYFQSIDYENNWNWKYYKNND